MRGEGGKGGGGVEGEGGGGDRIVLIKTLNTCGKHYITAVMRERGWLHVFLFRFRCLLQIYSIHIQYTRSNSTISRPKIFSF